MGSYVSSRRPGTWRRVVTAANASRAASRIVSHSYGTTSSGNITVVWFGASRSTKSTKFSRSWPTLGGDQPCRIRVGKRLRRMVGRAEPVRFLGIATDAHQIMPQELHGMVELVSGGPRDFLIGQQRRVKHRKIVQIVGGKLVRSPGCPLSAAVVV